MFPGLIGPVALQFSLLDILAGSFSQSSPFPPMGHSMIPRILE